MNHNMGKALIIPPDEPLDDIFTDNVILRLKERAAFSESASYRLRVLTASGPDTTDDWAQWNIPPLRAQRAAWDVYLYTAFANGLFEGTEGAELRGRLTSPDNDDFRSAMAECIACWVFSGKFKMELDVRPSGRRNKKLEFIAKSDVQDLYVEVKSPYREKPNQGWSGDDSDLIESCLIEATNQFEKGLCNILVIVPSLRIPVYSLRGQLIKAFYGEEKFVFDIDVEKGCATGPAEVKFFPEGRFLKTWKPEKAPRYKRVSAVLTIEERLREGSRSIWFDHNILLLKNPCAEVSCDLRILRDIPQFAQVGDYMKWTDGKKLFP